MPERRRSSPAATIRSGWVRERSVFGSFTFSRRAAVETRPAHEAAGGRAGNLAVAKHQNAIDEDMPHPRRETLRIIEGSVIADRGRIEHREIGMIASREPAAIGKTEIGGGKSGQAPNRLLQ